jgi:hypothetical protein
MARVYVLAGTKPIVETYPAKSRTPSGNGSTEVLEKGSRNIEISILNSIHLARVAAQSTPGEQFPALSDFGSVGRPPGGSPCGDFGARFMPFFSRTGAQEETEC